jgi:hypothetical protein
MTRVYGIEVNDTSAQNAKMQMNAQMAICICGFLGSIVGLVRYFTTMNSIENWIQDSGEADLETSPMRDGSMVLNSMIAVLIPPLLIMLVRNAIRHNKREIFTSICIFEGVCSVFAVFTALNAMTTIPVILTLQHQIDEYDCNAAVDATACEASRDPAKSFLSLTMWFVIVQLVLGIFEVAACVTGTSLAGVASKALKEGQVFTGAPQMPAVTAVTFGQPMTSSTGPEKVVDGVQATSTFAEQNKVVVGVPV